ncbi:MAG: sulfurtransferase-like selenium metabolism protein YedF [Deltaproteobacteria bacterium]|nr:sulfurtransferase-like selenium metabolism protein YedF [Deltaproteobacteria bacterium]
MTEPIDVRALPCPGPVMELRKRLDGGACEVVLHVADDLARSNVTRFATSRGAQVRVEIPPAGGLLVFVTVPGAVDASVASAEGDPETVCDVPVPSPGGPRIVQIAGPTMGFGDDDLGGLLLRGFLKTVGKVEPRPDIVVCYNGGAQLCCEGSPVLDDLRELEAAGVTILACGTCLNFFGLASKLAVGRVTDMLEITTTLGQAGHVVRP